MRAWLSILAVLFLSTVFAQSQAGDINGIDMSHISNPGSNSNSVRSHGDMHDMPAMESDSNSVAIRSMEGHHMDMGPHMKMTALRPMQPGDQAKADELVRAARAAAERYKDYKVALTDGYKIFLPNVPQKQYHFTNYWNAFQARNNFDPSRPTSLL